MKMQDEFVMLIASIATRHIDPNRRDETSPITVNEPVLLGSTWVLHIGFERLTIAAEIPNVSPDSANEWVDEMGGDEFLETLAERGRGLTPENEPVERGSDCVRATYYKHLAYEFFKKLKPRVQGMLVEGMAV